ncbi:MAG: tetratricopeptide repeat protein [Leptospira sp.]|nr:tetratricopeptide repeat protein [Leptospira sp.]
MFRQNKTIAILLSLVICLGFSVSAETLEDIKLADEFYQSQNYRKALTHYLNALESNPNSTTALVGYGYTSLALNSLNDANQAFKKALKLDSKNTKAMSGIGLVLLKQDKGVEARNYLESELKNKSYDQNLLLALAEVYEGLGKPDLATYKLESARSISEFDLPMLEKLGELYIQQNKLNRAESISEEIIQKNSDSLVGYRLLGKSKTILAYRSNPSTRQAEQLFSQAESAFNSALVISKDDEKTLLWKAKLYLWKSGSYRLEAEQIFRDLKSRFPENIIYSFFIANISYEKNNQSKTDKLIGEKAFTEILKNNDLDEISRFQAEEYALENFPTESTFRKKLGLYRQERYIAEKNSLNYQSSLFHLWRARDLIPNHPQTRALLMDAYKNNSDLVEFINLLSQIVKDDPGNFKVQNRLEYSVNASKKTLEYKEGYFSPTSRNITFKNPSTIPKLVVLDFHPQDEISEKIHSPTMMRLALNLSLRNQSGIRLASLQEEKSIFELIQSRKQNSYNPYHNAKFFDLNESPAYPKDVRFICIGKYKDTSKSIHIEFQIYDRLTGKFSEPIRLRAEGRSSLAFLSTSLAQKIQDFLPKEGNILRVKKEGVIINLGAKNKVSGKDKVVFLKNGKQVMEGTITQLGDIISLVKPNSLYWERELATGDPLVISVPTQ